MGRLKEAIRRIRTNPYFEPRIKFGRYRNIEPIEGKRCGLTEERGAELKCKLRKNPKATLLSGLNESEFLFCASDGVPKAKRIAIELILEGLWNNSDQAMGEEAISFFRLMNVLEVRSLNPVLEMKKTMITASAISVAVFSASFLWNSIVTIALWQLSALALGASVAYCVYVGMKQSEIIYLSDVRDGRKFVNETTVNQALKAIVADTSYIKEILAAAFLRSKLAQKDDANKDLRAILLGYVFSEARAIADSYTLIDSEVDAIKIGLGELGDIEAARVIKSVFDSYEFERPIGKEILNHVLMVNGKIGDNSELSITVLPEKMILGHLLRHFANVTRLGIEAGEAEN